MRELPILMNDATVRAVLEARKTVTRRLVTRLERFGPVTEFGKSDAPGCAWNFRARRGLWTVERHQRTAASKPLSDREGR
ncbi:hypothetical protein ACVWWJ_001587 [Luteibacter sp. HA06]|jgi:hypothetical protein